MKKAIILASALALSVSAFAQAPKPAESHFKWYGFIRNYYALDTRESISGTEELFYYAPKDVTNLANPEADDLNEGLNYRFSAMTSRLGVDVVGYEYKGWKMAGKIEADFYNGTSATANDKTTSASLTGTALFRMRQAYLTVQNNKWLIKAGQAWHPMAIDMPDVFSLNTGSPFGPFSRTPQFTLEYNLGGGLSIATSVIWQMQYTSTGPYGHSANYVRNGGGEAFAGIYYKSDSGLLLKAGLNYLNLVPRRNDGASKKVYEHIGTFTPFFYAQYKSGKFTAKAKTVFAESGEHVGLNGGYGISSVNADGSWNYTPSRNSSSWVSLQYADKGYQFIMFGGYVKNFGTKEALVGADGETSGYAKPLGYWFCKNSLTDGRLNSMWRLTPTIIRNFGKLALGVECEITSCAYGDTSKGINLATGLYDYGVHNVTNIRTQALLKYTF